MEHVKPKLICAVLCGVIAGCASDRIAGPAATIDTEIRGLLGDVTRLTEFAVIQNTGASEAGATYQRMETGFDAETAQLQAQWALAGNSAASRSLAALDADTGGSSSIGPATPTKLTAAPAQASAATAASSPTASLTTVVSILDQLSKPAGTNAGFESGINFVREANNSLTHKSAASASAPTAASAPSKNAK